MVQQVQELINKIKTEGIQAADQSAKDIEQTAKSNAQKIIDDAKVQAEAIKLEAQKEVKKMQESTHMALKQASRDTILTLKQEVQALLNKIIVSEVSSTLNPENLSAIILAIAKESLKDGTSKADIIVALNDKDLDKLNKGFLSKLQKQIKQPIKFEASDELHAGFTISYDGGKSNFDFSDESLASYLASYLNKQVADLVNESIK